MKRYRVTASSLNVREFPSTSAKKLAVIPTGSILTEVEIGPWKQISTAGGLRGWIHENHVEEVQTAISQALPVPHGLEQVLATFGKPGSPACHAGRVHLPAPLKVSWGNETVVVFACHEKIVSPMQAVFDEILSSGLWGALHDFGGCFADRKIRGSTTNVSTHAWGIAVDVDVANNPLGATPKIDPRVIAIFEKHGFIWGGRFKRKDGMHFQYATGI